VNLVHLQAPAIEPAGDSLAAARAEIERQGDHMRSLAGASAGSSLIVRSIAVAVSWSVMSSLIDPDRAAPMFGSAKSTPNRSRPQTSVSRSAADLQRVIPGIHVPGHRANERLTAADVLGVSIPVEELALAHRMRSIRGRLRGDTVVAMDNVGADLTFFDPL
jgi:hypothetical protein